VRLLQVCNVGQLCGGTAACAWTISRCFPDWDQTVLFLSDMSPDTQAGFSHCTVGRISHVDEKTLAAHRPDLVLLHNTSGRCVTPLRNTISMHYRHSVGPAAPADLTVACSDWLSEQLNGHPLIGHPPVLIQPVPRPPLLDAPACSPRHDELIIGRICTPSLRKWSVEALPVYSRIATAFPMVRWEFVGCPTALQSAWQTAVRGQATFSPAGWGARSRLWRWSALLYHHPGITESFGRTVAEALRCGCVPIVDARGGFQEQLTGSQAGFLCRTPAEFLTAVDVLTDRSSRESRSQNCLRAGESFSLQTFRRRFLTLCRALTESSDCTV